MGNLLDDIKDFGKESLGNVITGAGTYFGGAIGGAAGSYLGNQIMGDDGGASSARVPQGVNGKWVRKANRLDRIHQKSSEMQMWRRAKQRGLTAQEYYGSSAAGGVSSPTGNAQVMGNNLTALQEQAKAQQFEAEQNQLDRMAQLGTAAISADATKESAKTSAGATVESAEISADVQQLHAQIKQGELDLNTRQFEEIALPAAQANLKLTRQQILKVTNEVATSTPEFLRAMKILSMSAENLVATIMVNGMPVDPTDPDQIKKLPASSRSKLLTEMIGLQSATYREATGIQAKAKEVFEIFLNDIAEESRRQRKEVRGKKALQDKNDEIRQSPNYNHYYRGRYGLPPTLGVEG